MPPAVRVLVQVNFDGPYLNEEAELDFLVTTIGKKTKLAKILEHFFQKVAFLSYGRG